MCACPTKELVERYLNGMGAGNERQVFEEHLGQCDACREQIEATRSGMSEGGQYDSSAFSAGISGMEGDKTVAIDEDDRPTVQLSGATVAPGGQPDFAKSLESMIEGYKITDALPRGGQAVVYKAIHTATKTNVAIKVLLPTLLASERARYYFEREAELIASLDHPNIVSIRDSGIIHHQYYFVMQYIDGEPLRRYVQGERLSFRERVELVKKICLAITYAHQQGIIHRDLKFANIMVDKRGEPHILDFGLAKAVGMDEQVDDDAVATMTGQWAGSLSTMSPEQASGQPSLIDVRTDVYSLGVILYTLLTGQYPYDVGGPTLEALKNIQEAEPVRPRQIVPKFNSEMEAIVLTALEKQREKRYQSTAELQSDIENWLEGRPIRVKSISTMYLLRKIIGRHRYTSTVVLLLAMILIAFAWISFELFNNSEKARRASELDLKRLNRVDAKNLELSRRMTFTILLHAWNAGDRRYAERMAAYITPETKEYKAAGFLLDSRPIEEKLAGFKNTLANEVTGFAGFVIAEHYLRDGNRQEAENAYKKSYKTLMDLKRCGVPSDGWLEASLRVRLHELGNTDESADEASAVETGGSDK